MLSDDDDDDDASTFVCPASVSPAPSNDEDNAQAHHQLTNRPEGASFYRYRHGYDSEAKTKDPKQ